MKLFRKLKKRHIILPPLYSYHNDKLERELTEILHKELQTDLLKFMEQTGESKRVFDPIIKNVKRNIKQ